MLQGGRSGATQVVPRAWIQSTTRAVRVTSAAFGPTGPLAYGRLWWVGSLAGNELVLGWGYGGQFLAILPALDLVVVTTARWQGLGSAAGIQESAILDWIAGSILPAVR